MPKVECQQHKDLGEKVVMDEKDALSHYKNSFVPLSPTIGEHRCFSFEQIDNRDIIWVYTTDSSDGVKRTHWQKYDLTEVIDEGFIPPKV